MLDERAILTSIEQTMVADAKLIKDAEMKLFEYQKESGFSALLLKVVSNNDIQLNIRMSSAIYLKNKIQRSWINLDGEKKNLDADDITLEEQHVIKDNIVQVIVNNAENAHIRPHLTEAAHIMLSRSKNWDLTSIVTELLNSGKPDYIYAGLLLLFEICKVHRYDMCGNREVIDKFISAVFPIVEAILSQLVNENDYKSSELLYLILKSFKFACLNNFPQYFNDVEKLNSWVQLHLFICSKPLPKEVMELDPADRSLDRRVKVNKWGFGNLNRFIHRFARSTKNISEHFVSHVFTNLAPTVVQEYFVIIQSWSQGSLWLGDSSLFHLIQFLEKCMVTDELYPLIEPHLDAIVKNLIFTCLCADAQSVETFEIDPEEYTRRYFDFNKEGSTADVASTDFIFVVGHRRPEQLSTVLPFVNDIFHEFKTNSDDMNCAFKQEGAMRTISSLFSFFENSSSDLEGIFTHFIVNILSQNKYPFLVARALETVANFQDEFKDMDTLSKIYEITYQHLISTDILPIQIEAADALKTLIISNPNIHSHITSQVPGIMEKLLKLSKEFEIDILAEVMEAFVERFADELTPFAKDLARNLAEQFVRLGQSMVENSSGNNYGTGDQDQEIQASSLLQTMTTMVMSMNKVSLIEEFLPVCQFVVHNAQIVIMSETVDLMDSIALSSKTLYQQLTPEIWNLFSDILDSFQMYAMDYFECYTVFFESIVLFGFPRDQTYVPQFLQILAEKLASDIDYDIENVMSLLQMFALSMKEISLLSECLKVSENEELELEDKDIVKLLMANLFVKPLETLQICEMEGMTLKVFTKWFNNKFNSVYAIKLQILSILSLLKLNELPNCIAGFMGPLSNALVSSVEQLPNAIRRRDAASKGEDIIGNIVDGGDADPDDEDGYFEEMDDDFKETELDNINVFEEVHSFFSQLSNTNPERYQQVIGSMTNEKKESLQVILEFVSQKK